MDSDVLAIQRYYPRIYMACHTEHVRAVSSPAQLSARDATLLNHLSDTDFTYPKQLAAHLNVTQATLSEALAKLEELGYVTSRVDPDDERRRQLRLTKEGLAAVSSSSVLEYEKVKRLLAKLTDMEKQKAIEGMRIIAEAAGR
jgi:DNA-binding MarR family transcriptional regulator